jgi:hypothetical protein
MPLGLYMVVIMLWSQQWHVVDIIIKTWDKLNNYYSIAETCSWVQEILATFFHFILM